MHVYEGVNMDLHFLFELYFLLVFLFCWEDSLTKRKAPEHGCWNWTKIIAPFQKVKRRVVIRYAAAVRAVRAFCTGSLGLQ